MSVFAPIFILLVTLSAAFAQSQEPSLRYTAAQCKQNAKGMVFLAVGRLVIRQPAENLVHFSALTDADLRLLPAAPVPNDPAGCPGNPIRGAAFTLTRISSPLDIDRTDLKSVFVDSMRITINRASVLNTEDVVYAYICNHYKISIPDQDGLSGCKKPFHCGEDAVYRTTKRNSPDQDLVSLYCVAPHFCMSAPLSCFGGYLNQPGLAIYMSFTTSAVPLPEFPEANRILHERLTSSIDNAYPWR
jgi:hypothetical protein